MQIRPYRDADESELLRLNAALFPEHTIEDLKKWAREFRAQPDAQVFVIERPDGTLAGYVDAGSRVYAEGCETSPVGYIEAWYVDPDLRRQGYGRALLAAAEDWARSRGFREMGSDALLDNHVSHAAHKRAGFVEVERLVVFRKPLVELG